MDTRKLTSTLGFVLGGLWSALRAGARRTVTLLRVLGALLTGIATTVRRHLGGATGYAHTAAGQVRAAADAPATRTAACAIRTGLGGRRTDLTAAALVAVPPLALGAAWGVTATVGFARLHEWAVGTWYGTDPQALVFVAVGALLVLGAAHAAVNSGLIPTALLVAAPVFGAGAASYGTSFGYYETVSLPVAGQVGAAAALVVGVPLGAVAFLAGVGLRRAASGWVGAVRTGRGDPSD